MKITGKFSKEHEIHNRQEELIDQMRDNIKSDLTNNGRINYI